MEQGFATQLPLKTQLEKTLSQRKKSSLELPKSPSSNPSSLCILGKSLGGAPIPQTLNPLFKKKNN